MDSVARRVLFVSNDPPGHAVTRYRCDNLADVLRAEGWSVDVVYVGQSRVRVDHDIVVLHRICDNAEGRRFAAAARACGAALVYSTDDLIFDTETLAADSQVLPRYVRFAPLHAAMMTRADALLVSTDFLQTRARALWPGKTVCLIRNFVGPELLSVSETAQSAERPVAGRVVLGYLSGSASHDGDLVTIAAVLRDVLTAYATVELLLVGPISLPTEWEATLPGRIRRLPFVPWRDLPSVLAGIDINLAPLDARRAFNQAKSELKQLEAAAVGIPTIATRAAGFAEIESQSSALLADSPSEWRSHLDLLLHDALARKTWGERARSALLREGTATAWSAPMVTAFAEFAALPRSTGNRKAHLVNWPFSPKHALKGALRRLRP